MNEQFSRWDVVDNLSSPEDMLLYFDACLAEDAGDGRLIKAALNDIARARGLAELAIVAGLSRDGLALALSPEGNPDFGTILKLTKALGIQLQAVAR